MSDETIEVGSYQDESRVGFTQIGDWSMCVPMSHTARTLYMILRSLVHEKEGPETRKVTDDDLRRLMGITEGTKVPSRTTLYRIRAELTDLDMLQVENVYGHSAGTGAPKVISRRYLVRREPHPGRPYVSSSWTLLNRLAQAQEEGASPAEMDSVPYLVQAALGSSVPNTGRAIPQTGQNRAVTSDAAPLNKPSSKKPLPVPGTSTRLAARKGRGSGRTKKTTKINKDFSHKHLSIAEALVSDLPGSVTGTDHAKLVPLVCAAFDSGWSPSGLSAHLRANCRVDRVQFHGSVYVKHAEDLPPAGKDESSRALVELCSVCDEHGFSLDPAACSKDPEAIPHTCLHGEPDPWDSPEYRAERQAERDEAAHVRLRAQEAALREKERRQAREAREAALRAEKEAQEAKAVVERRERAQAFLSTAPSTGSEVADRVRAVVLAMAADPPETASGQRDELDTVVDLGTGLVEATGEISDLVEIVRTLPRRDWLMAIIDRTDEAEAVKRAKAAQEKAAKVSA